MSMIRNNLSLIICIFSCFLIALKIYIGSNVFLVLFLLVICLAIICDKIENKFTYLLFFLPWIYTMKFQFDQFSLFLFISVLYIFVSILYIMISGKKIQSNFLLSYFLFVIFVVSTSLIQGGSIISVLGFIVNFTVVTLAVLFVGNKKQFGKYTIIYSIGLLTASIVRLISYVVPTMEKYFLDMTTMYTLVVNGNLNFRFSGLDLDPNYYSMHILIAVTCLLVNVYHHDEKKFISILLILILSLFGLFSLSKMYLISILFFIVLTTLILLRNNLKFGLKFSFLLLFTGVVGTLFTFDYFYASFEQRFNLEAGNLEILTTGRSTAWEIYIIEIVNNFKILLIGAGYGTGFLDNVFPHNMYITAFYNFGFIGIVTILFYIFNMRKIFFIRTKQKENSNILKVSSIPLLILLFSNFSLDSIVMDFFPIHLFLVLFSLTYNQKRNSPLVERQILFRSG